MRPRIVASDLRLTSRALRGREAGMLAEIGKALRQIAPGQIVG